jgi:hypothetical protein
MDSLLIDDRYIRNITEEPILNQQLLLIKE